MTNEEKNFGLFLHLGALSGFLGLPLGTIVVPLVLWLIKKNESPYVNQQGKSSLNFQLSILVYLLGSIVLMLFAIGFILVWAVLIFDIVCVILASVKADKGVVFQYPLSIPFIK